MKKVLITVLTILLCAVIALSLVACGGEKTSEVKGPAEDVSVYHSGDGYDTVNDILTWDKINAFPIVSDDMTIEEGRKLVVDFFRFCKTVVWIPNDHYEYTIESSGNLAQVAGYEKYGGLPYITNGTGTVYRMMDYMDTETGVMDITTIGERPIHLGNQCSFGSYVGVSRVVNSCRYSYTKYMTPMNGFIPLGDYVVKPDVEKFDTVVYNTPAVLKENGQDVMNEAYAELKAGDIIMYYTSAGHVVLISQDAVVVRDANGKIDPAQSYVMVIDQTAKLTTMTNEAGDVFNLESNVDAKWTFLKLFGGNYIPYTFKEWTGEDPIESTKTEYSYSGETITLNDIYKSKVTSNYGVMDLYASVYHSNGKEVYKIAVRSTDCSVKELAFRKPSAGTYDIVTWGNVEDLDPNQEYTVKIYAQISSGERPTLWEGKLVQE